MKIARPLTSNASKEKLGEKEIKNKYSGMPAPVVSIRYLRTRSGKLNINSVLYVVVNANKSLPRD